MFASGSKLSAGKVSSRILDYGSRYARFVGFFWFAIEVNPRNGSLVARKNLWYKKFCLLTRLVMTSLYIYICWKQSANFTKRNLAPLILVICFLIWSCIIMFMQLWCDHRVLRVVNDFLRLFRRIKALPGCQDTGFGGKRELTLLIFKLICLSYEIPFVLLKLQSSFESVVEIYASINGALITHSCFVGFLSVGTLYDQMNRYVRHELRRQLRSLKKSRGVEPSRQELNCAEKRLDECVAIYDEIQRVSNSFQKLMDLPLCLALLILFVSMSFVSYYIVCNGFRHVSLLVNVFKMFFDLLLLTLVVHGATMNSRVIQRLKLENCYVCENKVWNMRLEMFLSRLNFYEFHVRPMGLFEISNELILVYITGLVTYLTYLMQYEIKWDSYCSLQ